MTKHLVIPDTQVKPGDKAEHLRWAGEYAAEKKPDVIIHIGDHWDMPSLSSYDVGKKSFEGRRYINDINAGIDAMKSFEGRRYINDINAGIDAMRKFLEPIQREQERLKRNKWKQWNPRLVFTLGNHEHRIERAIESDPKLDGLLKYDDFMLEEMGFEVVPFLEPIVIDDIAYCHYFTSGVMGRPVSSAKLMLAKKYMSCVMGHVQDRDIAYARKADGTNLLGLFSGIFYQHDEDYLTPQTNGSWAGIWMLNEVANGGCDELPVSINYLRQKYGEEDGSNLLRFTG